MSVTSSNGRHSGGRDGIFVYGYYGAGNVGDSLLLRASLEGLRGILPGATFYVRDHGDLRGLEDLGSDVVFTGIERHLAGESRARPIRFLRYLRAYVTYFRRCRWLVFGGGTVFNDPGSPKPLLLQVAICLLARALGVRIAALGVGIGALRSATARRAMRVIVSLCDVFLVRDEASLAACSAPWVRRTADLAYGIADVGSRRPPAERSIGLAVCPPGFQAHDMDRAVVAFAAAVRGWRAEGLRVRFLVFQRPGATAGDDPMLRAIARASGADDIEVRVVDHDARAIADTLGDLSVVCGMRFHGLVLASRLGLPFVGVAHDSKITDICRQFAMPCLPASSFTGETLLEEVGSVIWRAPDPRTAAELAAAAVENFTIFSKVAQR